LKQHQTTEMLVTEFSEREFRPADLNLRPLSLPPGGVGAVDPSDIPTRLDQLDNNDTSAYDLSITAALDANIPVLGVSGDLNRRVIVLERAVYKIVMDGETTLHYGYAIRFCLTVNKFDAKLKLTLPILTASAELGIVEAKWVLQIRGLAGPKITAAILPPTELNVETFVLIKQSLTAAIDAVNDATTVFKAEPIAKIVPIPDEEKDLRGSAVKSFALTAIQAGRSLQAARDRLGSDEAFDNDTLASVYNQILGILDPQLEPNGDQKKKARGFLGQIRADV
jgi:hypothetical protein